MKIVLLESLGISQELLDSSPLPVSTTSLSMRPKPKASKSAIRPAIRQLP